MNQLEGKLESLRERFRADAANRATVLERAALDADYDTIIAESHRLAGICGMLGHADLGRMAMEVEEAMLSQPNASVDLAPLIAHLRSL